MIMNELFRSEGNKRLCDIIRDKRTITLDDIKLRFTAKRDAAVFVQRLLDHNFIRTEDGEVFHYIEGSEEDHGQFNRKTMLEAARWLHAVLRTLPPFTKQDGRSLIRGLSAQPPIMKHNEAGVTYYFSPVGTRCTACGDLIENYGFLVADWNPGRGGKDSLFHLICERCAQKVTLPPNHHAQEIYPFVQIKEGSELPKPVFPLILTPPSMQNAHPSGGVIIDKTVHAGREEYTFDDHSPVITGKTVGEAIAAKDRTNLPVSEAHRLVEELASGTPVEPEKVVDPRKNTPEEKDRLEGLKAIRKQMRLELKAKNPQLTTVEADKIIDEQLKIGNEDA